MSPLPGATQPVTFISLFIIPLPILRPSLPARQRAEGHRGAGDHRAERQAEQRIEECGGRRHAEDVVDTRKEQVLARRELPLDTPVEIAFTPSRGDTGFVCVMGMFKGAVSAE